MTNEGISISKNIDRYHLVYKLLEQYKVLGVLESESVQR